MKKMIFSAVALVAFSVSGMANEIEEKRLKKSITMLKQLLVVTIVMIMLID